jgi:lysozyme
MTIDWKTRLVEDLKIDEGGPYLHAYPDPLSPMGKRLGRTGVINCARNGYLPPKELTRLHEGRPWTIGYGRARNVKYGDKITKEVAEKWLLEDVETAIKDAEDIVGPSWNSLNGPRKAVLANMAYNLGREKLSEFKNTLKFVRLGLFDFAAVQMANSLWAKQVKRRADRLIKQMNLGEYQPNG